MSAQRLSQRLSVSASKHFLPLPATIKVPMQFQAVVEDSGRFEVEEFRIGRTNSEASYLRLKVEAPEDASLQRLLQALHELGCSAVDAGDAVLREVEQDRCAPEDFYSTTNHRTYVRQGQKWLEAENQRMDAMIVVAG